MPRSTRRSTIPVLTDLSSTMLAVLGYGLVAGSPPARLLVLGLGLLAVAAGCLALSGAWDPATSDSGEFARLVRGFVDATTIATLITLLAGVGSERPWVVAVLPAAAVLAAVGRLGLRALTRPRGPAARVLAVGTEEAVAELIRCTRAAPRLGWRVEAVCTPTGAGPNGGAYVEQVHVVGDLDSVPALTRGGRFDLVSVSRAPGWTPWRLQQLVGELEGTATELAVDPLLTGLTRPRRKRGRG
jgi:hypothetical protein